MKEGDVSCELSGFLTTEANAEVAAHRSKAVRAILTDPGD